ncbi:MAG: gamma-glutamyl-gamma-aminobutyrate hydrolase family protein [Bacteroidales bacterium]|nr:gamma-glutamyl-gamma-aminobutyrate hydrolase family protein [Bacteroidales bacterium]
MLSHKKILIFLIISVLFFFASCNQKTANKTITIAISKAEPIEFYGKYSEWLLKGNADVELINMYELGVDSALKILDMCDGLLVTGGADVYPAWYGKLADTARCGSFDFYRDSLEIGLIHKALERKIPIVGICRGEQILNVALGGSLIIDIPTDHDTLVKHRLVDWENCYHPVDLIENTLLQSICQPTNLQINSNHHQAVDVLSPQLKVSAYAPDGIIEAVEWKQPEGKSFLIAVQWHPERLDSANADLSLPICEKFLKEAELYHLKK